MWKAWPNTISPTGSPVSPAIAIGDRSTSSPSTSSSSQCRLRLQRHRERVDPRAARRHRLLRGHGARGLWGLFGSYDYLSPQIFRVSTTALSLGTVVQWWLSRVVAFQGTALGGVGFGAAGTVADRAERDYHFGVVPQVVLGSRLIFGDRAMLEVLGRGFFVAAGSGREGGVSTSNIGGEIIGRVNAGFSVRIWGPHALGIQYAVSTRDAHQSGLPTAISGSIPSASPTTSWDAPGSARWSGAEMRAAATDR